MYLKKKIFQLLFKFSVLLYFKNKQTKNSVFSGLIYMEI